MLMTSVHTWSLLPNDSEHLGITIGREGGFLSSSAVSVTVPTFAAMWAGLRALRLPLPIHMAEKKIFISQDTDFSYNAVDTWVDTACLGSGVLTIALTQKGAVCLRANCRQF